MQYIAFPLYSYYCIAPYSQFLIFGSVGEVTLGGGGVWSASRGWGIYQNKVNNNGGCRRSGFCVFRVRRCNFTAFCVVFANFQGNGTGGQRSGWYLWVGNSLWY